MVTPVEPPARIDLARAQALLDLGRAEQARALLGESVGRQPDSPQAWCLLASACLDTEDYPRALDAASEAVRLTPDDPWVHSLGARALSGVGRHHDAVAAAERAQALDPSGWQPHAQLALVLNEIPLAHERTWQHAAYAVAMAPDQPTAHLVMGIVAHSGGHHEQARHAYRTTLSLDPSETVAQHNLAVIALNTGSVREAAAGLRHAGATSPDLQHVRDNLVLVADRLLGRMTWAVVAVLVVTALLVGPGRSAPWLSAINAAVLVLSVVVITGALDRVDRTVIRGMLPTKRRQSIWAGLLGLAAALTCLLPISGSAGAAMAGIAMLLLLVGPVWTAAERAGGEAT